MKASWDTARLGEVTSERPKSKLQVRDASKSGEYPFFSSGASIVTHNVGICRGENIFVATGGKAFVHFYDGEAAYSTDCLVLSTGGRLLTKFLYYFLKSKTDYIDKALFEGAALKHLQKKKFRELEVPLPRLAEQKRIVQLLEEMLAAIDEAKAKHEEILMSLGTIVGAIFDHAISGKLTQEWRAAPNVVGDAGNDLKLRLAYLRKNQEGGGKYREPDAAIPHSQISLPIGWTLASPEQVTTHIVDCPHSTPKWTDSGIPCLRTSNFRPGRLDLQSLRYVSQQTYKERIARLEPRPGDVLYSREGSILGIACIIPEGLMACLGQRMMLMRADTSLILPEYLTAVLNSSLILKEVKRLTSGAGSPHLNICDIRTFPIPLPTLNEQRQIIVKLGVTLDESFQLTKTHRMKISNLDKLRSSLLSQAFAGELAT